MEYSLENWLDDLNREGMTLFHHLNLYKEVGKIILRNHRLKKMDWTLLSWMQKAFTVDLVIGVSRLCDKKSGTRSLVQFLKKLRISDVYLSRERYVKLYEESSISIFDLSDRHFDKLAGHGKKYYPKDRIDKDIILLTKKQPIRGIVDFRNRYFAHLVEDKGYVPKYRELYKAFSILEKIMKKYNLLIRAASFRTFTPTIQGNWQEVLTIPWVRIKHHGKVSVY